MPISGIDYLFAKDRKQKIKTIKKTKMNGIHIEKELPGNATCVPVYTQMNSA